MPEQRPDPDSVSAEILLRLKKAESARRKLARQVEKKIESSDTAFDAKWDEFKEKWNKDLNTDLGTANWREEIKAALQRLADWKRTLAGLLVVALLAGGSAAGVHEYLMSGLTQLKSAAEETQTKAQKNLNDLQTKLTEQGNQLYSDAAKTLDQRLERVLSSDMLMDNAFQHAKIDLSNQIEGQLRDETFTGMVSLMSNISLALEFESRGVEQSAGRSITSISSLRDPTQTKDLLYSVRALCSLYGPQLAGGKLDPRRRVSLLYVLNGIIARNHGDEGTAERWYQSAHDFDPNFPEASVFLAQSYQQDVSYDFNGSFGPSPRQSEIAPLLKLAIQLSPDDLECRLAQIDLDWQEKNWGSAIAAADDEIHRELEESHALGFDMLADPRAYYKLGYSFARRYTAQDCPKDHPFKLHMMNDRLDAVRSFRAAVLDDNDYVKALTNVVWYATHNWDDKFLDLTDSQQINFPLDPKLPNGEKFSLDELVERVNALSDDAVAYRSPQLLNTVAEAKFVLGQYYWCEHHVEKADEAFAACLEKARQSVECARNYSPKDGPGLLKRTQQLSDEIKKLIPAKQ